MKTLNIGIVGCGGIARAHVAAYRAVGDSKIVAVFDSNRAAAEALAKECGAVVAESVLALANDYALDAVSVCSPPATHLEASLPFIERRIAVLCEKPLEATVPAAQQLAAAVQQHRAIFMPAFCHRFHPAIIELKKLIDGGVLGEPLLFRNCFGGYFPLAGTFRADPLISGGGAVIDNGCHSIDLYRFLMGDPTDAQGTTATVLQPAPVEDYGMFHLSIGGKRFGQIISSYSLKTAAATVEVHGTLGSATVTYFAPGVPDLVYRLDGAAEPVVVDCSAHPDRFAGEVAHFLGCVRSGAQTALTADDGLRANQIVAAVYRSARSGSRVMIDLTD